MKKLDIILGLKYELHYSVPSQGMIEALRGGGEALVGITKEFQDHFEFVHRKLEALLRTVAGIKYLHWRDLPAWPSMFTTPIFPFEGVDWQFDGGQTHPIHLPQDDRQRETRPLFQPFNLLTLDRLSNMRRRAADDFTLDRDLIEILRIRDRAEGESLRIAAIEATSLIEVVLRRYTFEALVRRGFSRHRLNGMKRDITLAILLNAMVPLALEQGELDSLRDQILSADGLRRERNRLIHDDRHNDVNQEVVLRGIDGAVEVVDHLKRKAKTQI